MNLNYRQIRKQFSDIGLGRDNLLGTTGSVLLSMGGM